MTITISKIVNEAILIFKRNNASEKFSISFDEKIRSYPNGVYCHAVIIQWDMFFDYICGNGWMYGQGNHIFLTITEIL
ncbi:hypothetical protein M2132_001043 [Dysgonomonas sp. PH5-45]|nr:hypothetical protein [Dysgonomonas sp. PH5-45]MDH6387613.1 hypothetical protein [Dysgonomonas sp. PH5-37]